MARDENAAFPTPADGYNGMNVREFFAAHALQGLVANPAFNPSDVHRTATLAWELADAAYGAYGESRRLQDTLRKRAHAMQACPCTDCGHNRANECQDTCECCVNNAADGHAPCWEV